MNNTISAVLEKHSLWAVEQGDCLQLMAALPEQSIDLCCFSPPYTQARLYLEDGKDLGIARDAEEWTAWMVEVFRACLRVCKGLVVCVCEGNTKDYRWNAAPALLMADLHRAGIHLRKPPIYRRVGIPGSGGPDWWRNDYEFCLCATHGGKLPWSDNTATGHPPKWSAGGEMSNRTTEGKRVNAWKIREGSPAIGGRRPNGKPRSSESPPRLRTKGGSPKDSCASQPVIANPGNVVQELYTAEEVAAILGQPADLVDCNVGGGLLGSDFAHDNEAPYPEDLVIPFVRCFCPEGGIVLDPFAGSGTTLAVALKWGRRAIGYDLRESQCELTTRRIKEEATTMFDAIPVEPTLFPTEAGGPRT